MMEAKDEIAGTEPEMTDQEIEKYISQLEFYCAGCVSGGSFRKRKPIFMKSGGVDIVRLICPACGLIVDHLKGPFSNYLEIQKDRGLID